MQTFTIASFIALAQLVESMSNVSAKECICFSTCDFDSTTRFLNSIPRSVVTTASPWHGYLQAVYGAPVRLPFDLHSLTFFYHNDQEWRKKNPHVHWPMASCSLRTSVVADRAEHVHQNPIWPGQFNMVRGEQTMLSLGVNDPFKRKSLAVDLRATCDPRVCDSWTESGKRHRNVEVMTVIGLFNHADETGGAVMYFHNNESKRERIDISSDGRRMFWGRAHLTSNRTSCKGEVERSSYIACEGQSVIKLYFVRCDNLIDPFPGFFFGGGGGVYLSVS